MLSRLTQGRGLAGLFQPSTPGSPVGEERDRPSYVAPIDSEWKRRGQRVPLMAMLVELPMGFGVRILPYAPDQELAVRSQK